jgi:antitoxin ParD1/3/4
MRAVLPVPSISVGTRDIFGWNALPVICPRGFAMIINVSLTTQLEELVQQRVRSGRYSSASEVVRAALRLLEAHDREQDARIARLRSDVEAGLRQLDEGTARPFDEDAVASIKRGGRAALARVKKRTGRR